MKAYELLDAPEKWLKGADAQSATGTVVAATDPCATCWCLGGALLHCYGVRKYATPYDRVLAVLRRRYIGAGLVEWNDDPLRTYEEVVEVLEEADV